MFINLSYLSLHCTQPTYTHYFIFIVSKNERESQGRSQTGLTVAPYFIVINFHVSRFGLTVVPAARIVIGVHVSPTVGCVKHVTTVITVLTPPSLTCVNQPNYGFNMAAVIAFQAIFDSCISFLIIVLTFTRSHPCLSF